MFCQTYQPAFALIFINRTTGGIPEFLDSGRKCWTLDSGHWAPDFGYWTLDAEL